MSINLVKLPGFPLYRGLFRDGALEQKQPSNRAWEEIPFSPGKSPFFYGWMILLCAAVGVLCSLPGQTIGVSVFTESLILALDVSRFQLSAAYMLGTIASSLALPRAGRLYDRLGARVMTPVAALGLGATLIALSLIDRIVALISIALPLPTTWIALGTMFFFFSLLRFFGQGMMTMLSRNMAMKWFVRRRGMVNGILGVCVAVGFSSLAYALNSLVEGIGWSNAWLAMGLFIAILISTFTALFYRDSPEACGLLPDGDSGEVISVSNQGVLEDGAALSNAKQHFEFWIYSLTAAFTAMLVTAVSFHIISLFAEAGYDRSTAIGIYLPAAGFSVCCTLFGGWLSDKIRLCFLLRTLCAAECLLCVGLLFLDLSWGYWLTVVGLGLGQSMFALLLGLSWPRLFGVLYLGEISGFTMALAVFGSAIGPLLFGLAYDLSGSYWPAEISCFFVALFLLAGSSKAKH